MRIDLQNVNIRDVTNDWVKTNFSLDMERETLSIRKRYVLIHSEEFGILNFSSLEALFDKLLSKTQYIRDKILQKIAEENPMSLVVTYAFGENLDDERTNIIMLVKYDREETDEEVVSRLKQQVRKQIRSNIAKRTINKEKAEIERKERELYEKLKAKYETL